MNFDAQLDHFDNQCQVIETACGEGKMPFRVWSPKVRDAGISQNLVLLHGGSGSWNHWVKNIDALAVRHQLIIPDLPGFGDAAALAEGYQPQDTADWVASGIQQVIGNQQYHFVAFSWGSVIAALIAAQQPVQVKSIMLIGPASMGMMPKPLARKDLIPRNADMTLAEIDAVNKENLSRLMIYDKNKIDDFAVFLQTLNTRRARYRSPRFIDGTYVLDGLAETKMPLFILYGDRDASAYPNLDDREARARQVRPDVRFELVPDRGHWLPYEAPELVNSQCLNWIEAHSGS
ncbi:MAG: alpha/beta hydrolase [Pseudomonadales bacterium]|nr:alpha/beta hydrolase [Pseudomonadales bacterium]